MKLSLLLLTLFLSTAHATEGSGIRGGGDSLSSRIKMLRSALGEDGSLSRRSVRQALENLRKLRWDDPMGMKLVQQLESSDFFGDVDRAPYRLEPRCLDADGIERSATTERVDRKQNPEITPPPICINVRKLAAENATWAEIIGTLVHEHLRHFGESDVDPLEAHPSAVFITDQFRTLSDRELSQARAILPGVALFGESARGFTLLVRTREEARTLGLTVEAFEGKCGPAYVVYARSHFMKEYGERGSFFSASEDLELGRTYPLWDLRRERHMHREPAFANSQRTLLRVDEYRLFGGLIQRAAADCLARVRVGSVVLDIPVSFADTVKIDLKVVSTFWQ